ncbi:MAG: L,D-transpeptidase/peptidoglycan binding protein [Lachnospiraceae bacterium]|nr:L,D-transpeptidase/peptidoglycan binding protein [Lachnospiraceae bacterium]
MFSGIVGAFVILGMIITSIYGKTHFFGGTVINGIDASGMTVDELESRMREYSLTVTERTSDGDHVTEVITGDAIGVKVSNTDGLDEILKDQGFFKGIAAMLGKKERDYQIDGLYGYHADALQNAVLKLKGFREDFAKAPVDAGLSDYDPLEGFLVTPAQEGNQLNREKTLQVITEAVDGLLTQIDLDELGCYEKPQVYEDDPILTKLAEHSQKYARINITYDFGENKEVVDGNMICEWLDMDLETGDVSIDESKVDEFVSGLKKKYDTIFGTRTFHTSYGNDVTVKGGDYGWWLDVPAESAALKEMLKNGESGEREPVYHQTAASHSDKDWGYTYVEVNLTAQHVFVYKDGMRVFDCDCVSGNERRGFDTPEGTYSITYKERNAMLVGENYETPVSYWMPFNNNIGLHDAVWRDSFGGDIYKTSGSHGCVNLPYSAAKQIYSYVEKGIPVFCYHLSGTGTSSTSAQSPEQQAQAVIDAINAIGEVNKDSGKKITRARQLYNEASEEARACVGNLGVLEQAESALAGLG